jgi:hypothetical protein
MNFEKSASHSLFPRKRQSTASGIVLAGLVPAIHGVPSMFNSLEVEVLYPS